ncbi:MAG: tellurium resistance protein [Methylothermaceae bacteria B42]|nr:MAG: tellurium resistance protein [Methylothermaceae bacteria B42]HHJ38047.1 toxic anion resistance protein [Methylothermaceae bacterium]
MNESTSNPTTLAGSEVFTDQPLTLTTAPPEEKQAIELKVKEIDIHDTKSILFFGSQAQEKLTEVSDHMLERVKNKDIGPVGADLNNMVATLRGFDLDELNLNKKPGFFARLFGKARPVVKFLQRYEEVRKQIDSTVDKLEEHKTTLLTDITSLDRLYEANLGYLKELDRYIAAGEEKLRQLDEEIIPAKQQEVDSSGEVLDAQELKDLRTARDELERRIHDLRLTRQVAMQSLPSIRMVQENDKGLVNKISSTIVNTIPLWRQQLALAVTIYRSGEAASTLKSATDLTNELLESTAESLKTANAETRKQLERGVFDIESVKKANRTLIETIEESLKIADEGKRKRSEALVELQKCETELRQALSAARSHTTPNQPASS